MPAQTTPDLLAAYVEALTLEEAEQALQAIEGSEQAGELRVGDLYDELAECAANEDDFALAVRAESRALALGCDMPKLAREMLGWYLMKDGQRLAGEAEFEALRREFGDEPMLLITLGNARSDAGDEVAALPAFDEALASAKQRGDDYVTETARAERRACREELGLPMDDEDRRVPRHGLPPALSEPLTVAVGWFPRDEHAKVLRTWPGFEDDLLDADAYCRLIEVHLHELAEATRRRPVIAPLRVNDLMEHGESEGTDPGESSTRSSLAVELYRRGETLVWPPGRNEPCWCRSGRKYKRCCAA